MTGCALVPLHSPAGGEKAGESKAPAKTGEPKALTKTGEPKAPAKTSAQKVAELKALKQAEQRRLLAQLEAEEAEVAEAEKSLNEKKSSAESKDSDHRDSDGSEDHGVEVGVGDVIRYQQRPKKFMEAIVRKRTANFIKVVTSAGERLKLSHDVPKKILPGTGPRLLWHRGYEDYTIFAEAKLAPIPPPSDSGTVVNYGKMVGLVRAIAGVLGGSDSKEEPLPKWLQQMGKGQFLLTPSIGQVDLPNALDIVGLFRPLEASAEGAVLHRILVPVAYAVTFDPRDGSTQRKGMRMLCISFRAINKYKDRPARVAIADPINNEVNEHEHNMSLQAS